MNTQLLASLLSNPNSMSAIAVPQQSSAGTLDPMQVMKILSSMGGQKPPAQPQSQPELPVGTPTTPAPQAPGLFGFWK